MNLYLSIMENYRAWPGEHVARHAPVIELLAKAWAHDDLSIPSWREPVFPQDDNDDFVNFLGVGNAINFCFTDPKTGVQYRQEFRGCHWYGAMGMWASLMRAREAGMHILNWKFLSKDLTESHVEEIFASDRPLPLMKERFLQLYRVGALMKRRKFSDRIRDSRYRVFGSDGVMSQIVSYDAYFDSGWYHGCALPFHKRANLFAMMYHGRALASNGALPPMKDAADLTPPADYDVPRALRHLGILTYSDELARKVDAGEKIPKDSNMENEIRLQTVFAMRDLCDELSRVRQEPVTIAALDYKVWSAGRNVSTPHHRTATTAY